MMEISESLGFIGAGAMASAIIRGTIKAGVVSAQKVIASDPYPGMLEKYKDVGISTTSNNKDVFQFANVVILAVKPHIVVPVLKEAYDNGWITPKHMIISIAAGVTIGTIEANIPEAIPVVRVMPNTPCLVGASASGIAAGKAAAAGHVDLVSKIFSSIGVVHKVTETLLDAVTGLSGSGPAYVFLVIEALADGGVRSGLPRDVALSLATQTVFGAAKMVLETGSHPGVLKDQVCSPGGTTIAGVHALEQGGLRGSLIDAVYAATNRAKELSKPH
eukprot:Colp12_sorted_trinity150504_noHs@8323